MTEKKKSTPRSFLLDTIKCVMIFNVIFDHLPWQIEKNQVLIFPYFVKMAVPVFLLITAYLRTKKAEKEKFSLQSLLKESVHLLLPYLLVIGFHIFWRQIYTVERFSSFTSFLKWFFSRAAGLGSYYVPVLLQVLFLFPLLISLFKKNKFLALFFCFVSNFLFEAIFYFFPILFNLNPYPFQYLHRILCLRYLFVVGLGIFLAYEDLQSKFSVYRALLLGAGGALMIFVHSFVNPFTWFYSWKATSFLCVPFAYALLFFAMKYGQTMKESIFSKLGQASYYIYLVQIIYFTLFMPLLEKRYAISMLTNAVLAFVFSFTLGYVFFLLHRKVLNFSGLLRKRNV